MRRAADRWARGFRIGVVAGTAATLVLFAARLTAGVAMPQEALFEQLVRLVPPAIFALLLAVLQHFAKPLGFAAAVAASLFAFGVGGALYEAASREQRMARAVLGSLAAVVTWVALVYLPPAAGGVAHLGAPGRAAVWTHALALAAASLVYALLLMRLLERPVSLPPALRRDSGLTGRRALVRRSMLALLVLTAGSRLGARVEAERAGLTAATSGGVPLLPMMPPEVTPTGSFYRVSKNFPLDPSVDAATWALEVTGLVVRPLKLSFRDLVAAAPAVEQYQTLECISNEVGGDLIGNARWKGVRVRDILTRAGVRPDARTIIWQSADGYSESVSIDAAMGAAALLAFGMNGAPLSAQHGAPVRVLLPNRYGMKQPKWLTSIVVAGREAGRHRPRRGWSTQAIVKPASAFVAAARDGSGGDAVRLGGWAFAGSRGVARVELSDDGGVTWTPAVVKEPLGTNCWQFWQAIWTPPAAGEYRLLVRALDGGGKLQPAAFRRAPDGAEGYHEVRLHVTARKAS